MPVNVAAVLNFTGFKESLIICDRVIIQDRGGGECLYLEPSGSVFHSTLLQI